MAFLLLSEATILSGGRQVAVKEEISNLRGGTFPYLENGGGRDWRGWGFPYDHDVIYMEGLGSL